MRSLTVTLAAAVMAMAAMFPAAASTICPCSSGTLTAGGHCTTFGPCTISTHPEAMKPLHSVRACKHSQAISCDGDTCSLVCAKNAQ